MSYRWNTGKTRFGRPSIRGVLMAVVGVLFLATMAHGQPHAPGEGERETCAFFKDWENPGPLLSPKDVRCGLQDLWRSSHPDTGDFDAKQEQGAYIVELQGETQLISVSDYGECSVRYNPRDVPQEATIVGFVHTHPHKPSDPRPTSRECTGTRVGPVEYGHGPSGPDLRLAREMPFPSFVVEEDAVYRIPAFYGDDRYDRGEHITRVRR